MSGTSGISEPEAVDAAFERYVRALNTVDYQGALTALDEAISQGVPWPRLVSDVIAPAQRQVGERWLSGEIGVGDEHAATTVAENALAVLSPLPSASADTTRLIMVCTQGEWHTFPLRLAAAVASRSPDIQLTVLGGSISGEHLRRFIRGARPVAVALSTTLSAHLIGAARSIRAACEEGVPVVVGGAAWGEGQHRARRLGANLHVSDPTQLAAAVASLDGPRPVCELPTIAAEALLLDDPPRDLIRLALTRQARSTDSLHDMSEAQEEQALTDLSWLARHAANAVACDEPTIVGEVLHWLVRLSRPRGTPATAVLDAARYLAETVEPVAPVASRILHQQADEARALTDPGEDPGATPS